MDTNQEVVFEGMEPSDALRARILKEIARLERLYSRILSCRTVVEAPHRHHHKGKLYQVKIQHALPGHRDVSIGRSQELNRAHEDVYVAVRDAFRAARRQLQGLAGKE